MIVKKLPRKIKKELKKLILLGKDPLWKSKHVRIYNVKKHSRYAKQSPTHKGITVTGYTLG